MTNTLSKVASNTRTETLFTAFDAFDKQGRQFGARYLVHTVVFEQLPEGATSGYRQAPGTYFTGTPQACRSGEAFGACQRSTYFPTVEAAIAAGEAYLKRAEEGAMSNKARVR